MKIPRWLKTLGREWWRFNVESYWPSLAQIGINVTLAGFIFWKTGLSWPFGNQMVLVIIYGWIFYKADRRRNQQKIEKITAMLTGDKR